MPSPPYESDIFISYTHIDNEPFGEGQIHWVSRLHDLLTTRVSQLIGRKVTVWRDNKLGGNDDFGDELLGRVGKVAVLASVFSPRYFNSEWCRKELRGFLEAAGRAGGVRVGNRFRVFKLVRTPIPRQEVPADLQWLVDDALGYEFYRQLDSGRIRDFLFDPDLHRDYWLRLDDLAQDIAQTLRAMAEGQAAASASPPKGAVYLAETTSDMQGARDAIRRELVLRGYRVLPESPLPLRVSDLEPAVKEWAQAAQLSVHPLGAVYGMIPEGARESVVDLQLKAASGSSANGGLRRVVWIPRGLEPTEPRQKEFIERLRVSPEAGQGLEAFVGTVEELKTYVLDLLERQAPREKPRAEPVSVQVYLVCECHDFEKTRALRAALKERSYTVTWPLFEGSDAEIREEHQAALAECQAVIVYYGGISEAWLRQKLRELAKAFGWGRTAPFRSRAVYLAGDLPAEKREVPAGPPAIDLLLEGAEPFSPERLQAFFAAVEQPPRD